MTVSIEEGKLSNAPIPREKLEDIIESSYEMLSNDSGSSFEHNDDQFKNLMIQTLLETLEKEASNYKYIITLTSIQQSIDNNILQTNNNIKISTSTGALWNTKKDGIFNYNLRSKTFVEKQYLITIIWIRH